MSRKMVLKNTRSRSHFWLKNLRVQPLFVFWDPGLLSLLYNTLLRGSLPMTYVDIFRCDSISSSHPISESVSYTFRSQGDY